MKNSNDCQTNRVKKQITQKLNEMLQKRLKYRFQQKLSRHYTNCQYSEQFNRFYVCCNKCNLNKNSYLICSQQNCNNCKLYKSKYNNENKNVIQQQFYRDINDPAICGNKQPKIAILIWVLKLFSEHQCIQDAYIKKQTLWSKIKSWIKNGFVSK